MMAIRLPQKERNIQKGLKRFRLPRCLQKVMLKMLRSQWRGDVCTGLLRDVTAWLSGYPCTNLRTLKQCPPGRD